MAPKTLSSFLSPFTLPYTLTIPTTKILTLHSKPTLILCTYSHRQNTHRKSSVSETQYPNSPPEPAGTGAAAPTPGDRFLERHRSVEAAKVLLKEKKKKKKEKPKVTTTVPCCYGCGAPLQTSEPDAPGYSDPETYALVWIMWFYLKFCSFWIIGYLGSLFVLYMFGMSDFLSKKSTFESKVLLLILHRCKIFVLFVTKFECAEEEAPPA